MLSVSPLNEHELEQLSRWTPAVRELLKNTLQDERGVHIESAISGIAAVAGCLLLRSTGVKLDHLRPGTPVFVDAVNDLGAAHFDFMSAACAALRVEARRGWTEPVPTIHEPRERAPELTRSLEGPFVELCERLGVPAEKRAQLASFTAITLIREGVDILSAHVGKAIVLAALVAGSKTVPPREGRSLWQRLGSLRRAALFA